MHEHFYLNKDWILKPAPGATLPREMAVLKDGIKASVPGTVYTDLLNAGLIDDPFYGDNEKHLQWIADTEWIYETAFALPAAFKNNKSLFLVFAGLDTIADIYFNKKLLDHTTNMFRQYEYEIGVKIKPEKNYLKIHFKSARQYAIQNQSPLKQFPSARNPERVFVRKAQYSFGWDWGPAFPTAGIWRPIYLSTYNRMRINSVRFDTIALDGRTAEVQIKVALSGEIQPDDRLQVKLYNSKHEFSHRILVNEEKVYVINLKIPDPDLWWPNGIGEPSLYQLEIEVKDRGEKVLDRWTQKAGIRTVELQLKEDDKNTFRFLINKKAVFVKGANWIPADSFLPRVQENNYHYLLSQARDAHMNMIRVWGGGVYEDDVFYRICDELGLMVWQDFMFACAAYPDTKEFLQEITAEIEQNINRLQYHPSLIIWCGNNENEWIWYRDGCGNLEDMPGFALFHEKIPEILKRLDPFRPYWPTTPFGEDHDPNDSRSGNRHAWDIWSQWVDYSEVIKDKSHFVTEFGFQGPANFSTLANVIPKGEMQPHARLFEFHNKQEEGPERLTRFLAGHLPLTTEIDNYIYLTQLNQGLALKTCLEHWRLNWPATNGSVIWQLNDCWPVASWALIDYKGLPKLAYHFVSRAFQPLIAAFRVHNQKLELLTSNQSPRDYTGYADLIELNLAESQIFDKQKIPFTSKAFQNEVLKSFVLTDSIIQGRHILITTLYDDADQPVNRNYYFASRWKHINLPDSQVHLDYVPEKTDQINIKSGDSAVFFATLDHPELKFSDNAVILLPGEQYTIALSGEGSPADQINKIKIYTLNKLLRK